MDECMVPNEIKQNDINYDNDKTFVAHPRLDKPIIFACKPLTFLAIVQDGHGLRVNLCGLRVNPVWLCDSRQHAWYSYVCHAYKQKQKTNVGLCE